MKKIDELTNKIYQEGVEKGKAEAQRIVEEAQAEAQRIIAEAQGKAQELTAEAEKKAAELDKNTKSELKLYTDQAVNALKSEITTLISDKLLKEGVQKATSSTDFLGEFLVSLASRWDEKEQMVISAPEADKLKAYFASHAKELLDKGLTIQKINGKDVLFSVSPADGSYKINFGEEEFINYLKDFLRPQLIEMLF